ncbi:MAG: Sulfate adenylyltransferase subunit 1 [uncultured Acidimicrobiales bacterium]|uniref:Sulfate adenylyltransferase subunit 1 n=1 Tax=uncultured Acidimicrobiales bacterium TaxID=310071 RepID=A0A6J4IYX2_9ACTN|nr:MAG: Sulfate adenylyltransferase subunit 1 [uncultured Acidimicrobiales bacterium]
MAPRRPSSAHGPLAASMAGTQRSPPTTFHARRHRPASEERAVRPVGTTGSRPPGRRSEFLRAPRGGRRRL